GWWPTHSSAQTSTQTPTQTQTPTDNKTTAIVGAWTLNTDLSDKPQQPRDSDQGQGNGGHRQGGSGHRGGGFGGGGGFCRGGVGAGGMGGGGGEPLEGSGGAPALERQEGKNHDPAGSPHDHRREFNDHHHGGRWPRGASDRQWKEDRG